jgi:hypothetical protein
VLMIGVPPNQVVSGAAGEGYFSSAFAAVEILRQSAAMDSGAGTLAEKIKSEPHMTVMGNVRFDANGGQSGNPYRLLVSKSGGFEDYQ